MPHRSPVLRSVARPTSSFSAAIVLAAALLAPMPAAVAADLESEVRRLCQPLVDAKIAPGLMVGVLHDGETTLVPVGSLTFDAKTPPTADTIYEIGSITKAFTGVLLADAVLRGEAAVEDPIGRYAPGGFETPEYDGEPIRLWHLATHTSALPRIPMDMDANDLTNPYATYTGARLWKYVDGFKLLAKPGKVHAYSNLGVGLLGSLLAQRAGKPYEALLQERICKPLGMSSTTTRLTTDAQRKRLAPPYEAGGARATSWDFDALAGCGAIRSSVNDMLKFGAAALADDDTPVCKAIRLAGEQKFPFKEGGGIGLGWMIAGDGQTRWHNGQTAGYAGALFVNRPLKCAVVVLGNGADPAVGLVGERIVQSIAGMKVDPPQVIKTVKVSADELERLIGVYASTHGFDLTVTREDDALKAQITGQPAFPVFAESPTRFRYRVVEAVLEFKLDGDSPAPEVALHQNGMEMRCVRRK